MSKQVTIYGGAGFVGRSVTPRLVAEGWQVRIASRTGKSPDGMTSDQVTYVACNITRDDDVRRAAEGTEVVVNCVGTFDATGPNRFTAIQAEGAGRIARIAQELGVAHMVHLSAIGADPNGKSAYARSKAAGEAGVLAHMPGATILRPSVIFGPDDQFFNRFAGMAKMGPTVPVVGATTRFQPVFVEDVAQAVAAGVTQRAAGVFELGGPEIATFHDLMAKMLKVIQRRRLILDIPLWAGAIIAAGADLGKKLTFGLLPTPITPDQVLSLKSDNVVSASAKTLLDLGVTPSSMDQILPTYLK